MPRRAKPFFFQGFWYTDAGGQRVKLAEGIENREAAEDALLDHLQHRRAGRSKSFAEITLKELVNKFLDHIRVNRSKDTFNDHYYSLNGFVRKHARKRVRELVFLDGDDFKNHLVRRGKKPNTVNHFINSLNACFNWAVKVARLVHENPFRELEKLSEQGRERQMSDGEFAALLRFCSDALFRQILLVLRFTGARPKEIRTLIWDQIDWERNLIVLLKHKASRTAKHPTPKTIYFPPFIGKLLLWRRRRYGANGHVFLNSRGVPWTKDAFRQRMSTLRQRAGIRPDANGEMLVLYSNRHTYLTQAVRGGVTGPQLQKLGGWTSLRMAQRYVHLNEADVAQAGAKAVERLRHHKSGK